MRCYYSILFWLVSLAVFAQTEQTTAIVDSLYREDQFYAGFAYNALNKRPKGVSQNGFSISYQLGFIRDMPINTRRNLAIGVGLGYTGNSINYNLLYNTDVTILEGVQYDRNRLTYHTIDIPIEFRWRTSTATNESFWRIYTGFKVGYVFTSKSSFKGQLGRLNFSNIPNLNKLQYGPTLSAGYGTWNINVYYGLNALFKDSVRVRGNSLDMSTIRIGLVFYML